MTAQNESQKAGPLGYCIPVLFWVAEYMDGSVFCQFDPETGHENLFKHVDQSHLRSFGWYPVSRKLADLVKAPQLRVNPLLHNYKINLGPGQSLIAHRQQKIHTVMAQICLQCRYIWQFRTNPGELSYPYSNGKIEMQDKDGHKYVAPQCPKCGAYTRLVCEKCNISRSKYAKADSAQFDYRCAQCQSDLPDRVRGVVFQERHTDYFLGYEQDGRNFVMKIYENGDVEGK